MRKNTDNTATKSKTIEEFLQDKKPVKMKRGRPPGTGKKTVKKYGKRQSTIIKMKIIEAPWVETTHPPVPPNSFSATYKPYFEKSQDIASFDWHVKSVKAKKPILNEKIPEKQRIYSIKSFRTKALALNYFKGAVDQIGKPQKSYVIILRDDSGRIFTSSEIASMEQAQAVRQSLMGNGTFALSVEEKKLPVVKIAKKRMYKARKSRNA